VQPPDPEKEIKLAGSRGVAGIAPMIEEAVLATSGERVSGALVHGIDPARHSAVSDVAKFVTPVGAGLVPGEYQAWLGVRLARQLRVGVGDRVTLVVPAPVISPAGLLPRQRRFEVTGLVDTQSEMDARGVFVHLDDARRLFRLGQGIAGYQLRLDDLFSTEDAYEAAEAAFGVDAVRVQPWTAVHGNLYQAIITQKVTMFVLLTFLVAVAAFNLVSGLVMVADQKRADVAILRSLGSSTGTVLKVFVSLGLLLGFTGLLLGVLAGVSTANALPGVLDAAASWSGRELMSQYFIGYLPVDVRFADVGTIIGLSTLLILGAAVYPAWKATRQPPVEILAHE
jgi:lipoprotein-releasing system permease protein